MLAYLLRVPRRPEKLVQAYCKRRERIVSSTIQKHCRAQWGEVQRYRCSSFLGHVARLSVSTHMCAIVNLRRSADWWAGDITRPTAEQRGQPRRRAPHRGRPMPAERSLVSACANASYSRRPWGRAARPTAYSRHAASGDYKFASTVYREGPRHPMRKAAPAS